MLMNGLLLSRLGRIEHISGTSNEQRKDTRFPGNDSAQQKEEQKKIKAQK